MVRPHTANLRQQCYKESLMIKGVASLKNWQWKEVLEKTEHRGRLWRMLRNVEVLYDRKIESEEVYGSCRGRKAGRNTRPMTT